MRTFHNLSIEELEKKIAVLKEKLENTEPDHITIGGLHHWKMVYEKELEKLFKKKYLEMKKKIYL